MVLVLVDTFVCLPCGIYILEWFVLIYISRI